MEDPITRFPSPGLRPDLPPPLPASTFATFAAGIGAPSCARTSSRPGFAYEQAGVEGGV
jgi:hypothetical protein